jgi:3'-phosphoadenosine 5'-phosphosulfate (PAPS) 3'-phosphatase
MTKLISTDLQGLLKTAVTAAEQAGELITRYASMNVEVLSKSGGSSEASQVLTEVDLRCQSLILEQLEDSLEQYDLAVLSEELEDDKQRLVKQAFWCIDPLDGTLAFTQSQAGYSVSIALVSREGEALIGVVHDPVSHNTYTAIKDQGAYKNNQPWQPLKKQRSDKLTLPCDRSLLKRTDFPKILRSLEIWASNNQLESINEQHHAGAVINACSVLEHPPAIYFKPPKPEVGGGSLWDFAATTCIYKEVGALVCDFRNNELNLNREDTTFMNQFGVIFSTEKELISLLQSMLFNA